MGGRLKAVQKSLSASQISIDCVPNKKNVDFEEMRPMKTSESGNLSSIKKLLLTFQKQRIILKLKFLSCIFALKHLQKQLVQEE